MPGDRANSFYDLMHVVDLYAYSGWLVAERLYGRLRARCCDRGCAAQSSRDRHCCSPPTGA